MAVAEPSFTPSLFIAYVAIGAPPPTEDGVTADVKSHANTTRNEANHDNCFSARNRILAAENHTLRKETKRAINSPGNRFGTKCSRIPGVYVYQITPPMVAILNPTEMIKYFFDTKLCGCVLFIDSVLKQILFLRG